MPGNIYNVQFFVLCWENELYLAKSDYSKLYDWALKTIKKVNVCKEPAFTITIGENIFYRRKQNLIAALWICCETVKWGRALGMEPGVCLGSLCIFYEAIYSFCTLNSSRQEYLSQMFCDDLNVVRHLKMSGNVKILHKY